MFLFNSLHPSDQSSVQSLSAQPSVTATISKVSARLALGSSESLSSPSFASFEQTTSMIMSIATALKAAQDASAASSAQASQTQKMWPHCQLIPSWSSTIKIKKQQSQHIFAQKSRCQTSRSHLTAMKTQWSSWRSSVDV